MRLNFFSPDEIASGNSATHDSLAVLRNTVLSCRLKDREEMEFCEKSFKYGRFLRGNILYVSQLKGPPQINLTIIQYCQITYLFCKFIS